MSTITCDMHEGRLKTDGAHERATRAKRLYKPIRMTLLLQISNMC